MVVFKEEKGVRVKSWPEEDRPREKLLRKGRRSLSNAELMAILINSGNKDESSVTVCRHILNVYRNNLDMLGRVSVQGLKRYKGIGDAKAATILAALELGRRRDEFIPEQAVIITNPDEAYTLMRPVFADLAHEEFWVVFLSNSKAVISKEMISIGGQTGTVADARIIFRAALEHRAASIILFHNHPSGNLKPSKADLELTRKLVYAGDLLDIRVDDHLIMTNKSFSSIINL